MQSDKLNVFDYDGTLITINSFKAVNKRFILLLLRKFKIATISYVLMWYFIRKLGLTSHINFKRKIVASFEKSLTEQQKHDIVQTVFNKNLNTHIYNLMLDSENTVISTASPFAYASRIDFGKENVVVISSLHPSSSIPDKTNYGLGKITNIRSYFAPESVRIDNFYTDSYDDQELIDFSDNAFLVKGDSSTKITQKGYIK